MKYFGEKSVSSVFYTLCHIGRYVLIVLAIAALLFGTFLIFFSMYEDSLHAQGYFSESQDTGDALAGEDWQAFKRVPLFLKLLMYPYFAVLMVLSWKILSRSRLLFHNFKGNVVFTKDNADLIGKIGKLLLISSVITFSLSGVLMSVFVLMLCEIFKSGSNLQEEHDLTV